VISGELLHNIFLSHINSQIALNYILNLSAFNHICYKYRTSDGTNEEKENGYEKEDKNTSLQ
jgi:phage terminase large subunit